jgi:hypothetical protein
LTDDLGEPVDLTADTVKLTARDYKGGSLKLQKVNGPGEHEDPTNGKTAFKIEPGDIVDTQTEDTFYWIYEIRRIQASGDEAVHIEGPFIVEPAVGD